MELEADRAGYPYLIHVDDHGLASLLFPDQEIQAIDVGQRRRLPDETGHRAWRSPGGEVFVMISGTPYLALDRVLSRTERAAAGELFFQMDVKPPFPDTPGDWEDRLEAAFTSRTE